jgi:hypothetical protein
VALPVLEEGAGAGAIGEVGGGTGELGGGREYVGEVLCEFVTDKFGVSNCERPGICTIRRCRPRPPVGLVPGEMAAPIPAPAKALAVAGLAVESAALASGTEGVVRVLGIGAVVVRVGDIWGAIAVPAIDRRFGTVAGAGERGLVLEPADGAVTIACPGRLVNFRWSERAVDADGVGVAGVTVLGSRGLLSDS